MRKKRLSKTGAFSINTGKDLRARIAWNDDYLRSSPNGKR